MRRSVDGEGAPLAGEPPAEVFKEPPTSLERGRFEEQTLPDGKSNKGRVQAYDGPIYIADAALYLKTHKPELGITDPYELTRDQFNAALDLLREQRKIIGRYWHDAAVQMDDFANEGVVASSSWPYQVNFIQGVPVGSVFPEEGVTGWADTTMMHINAPHPNCSYKWLEWSLNPKLQGDLAAWFGSVPAVPAACKGNELLTDTGCQTNGYRPVRQDLLLEDAQRHVPGRQAGMRAVLRVDDELHCRDWRTLNLI